MQVVEYQIVNQVLFQGNKKIKDVQLSSTVQLKPRGSYSPDALDADARAREVRTVQPSSPREPAERGASSRSVDGVEGAPER